MQSVCKLIFPDIVIKTIVFCNFVYCNIILMWKGATLLVIQYLKFSCVLCDGTYGKSNSKSYYNIGCNIEYKKKLFFVNIAIFFQNVVIMVDLNTALMKFLDVSSVATVIQGTTSIPTQKFANLSIYIYFFHIHETEFSIIFINNFVSLFTLFNIII